MLVTMPQFKIISIHAPMKGATNAWAGLKAGQDISIHAPMKGATDRQMIQPETSRISIHAPMKGATAKLDKLSCSLLYNTPKIISQ